MTDSVDLRIEAERFRRLADRIGDEETKARLLRMADDFERWADESSSDRPSSVSTPGVVAR